MVDMTPQDLSGIPSLLDGCNTIFKCWSILFMVPRVHIDSEIITTNNGFNVWSSWQLESHSWWCHQMETFSALLANCAGNSLVPGEFPHKGQWRGALMFFYLRLNKRLNKQSWGWWFKTPWFPLWCHCNVHFKLLFSHQRHLDTGKEPILLTWITFNHNMDK